ncbi:MAG: EthD domain-containing protein [Chloroflexota bacterium]
MQKHAPLVASHAETLRIKRYVQSLTLDQPNLQQALAASRGAGEPYDGVAELWWDSLEDLSASSATPEGRAASRELLEDEAKFIDHARSPLWVSQEHEIVQS